LARNQAIHIYKETAEERMVSKFKTLITAKQDSQEAYNAALKTLQERATDTNSRHSAVFQSNDAIEFYRTLLELGEPYHQMPCIEVKWAQDVFQGVYGGVSLHFVARILSPLLLYRTASH
jgi:predicted nucleotide-binding protein (sugar kinase/HSP70/actin superfamily)